MTEFKLHRIKEIADEKGRSIRWVGLNAGLSASSVAEMIKRNRGSVLNIMKIANILEVDVSEFIDGPFTLPSDMSGIEKSLETIRAISSNLKQTNNSTIPHGNFIPLITFDIMAQSRLSDLLSQPDERMKYYSIPNVVADFIVTMPGKAMSPAYEPGDMLMCQFTNPEVFPIIEYGMAYVTEIEGGQFYVRRVMPGDNQDTLLFDSPNEDFPGFLLERSKVVSLSKIVGLLRI